MGGISETEVLEKLPSDRVFIDVVTEPDFAIEPDGATADLFSENFEKSIVFLLENSIDILAFFTLQKQAKTA